MVGMNLACRSNDNVFLTAFTGCVFAPPIASIFNKRFCLSFHTKKTNILFGHGSLLFILYPKEKEKSEYNTHLNQSICKQIIAREYERRS